MRISEQELADAPIEKLRAEIKLLWKAFKEIDECENAVTSNQVAVPGQCKLCRDCMIRVAYHKPLEKPRLTVVSNNDEAPGIGDS